MGLELPDRPHFPEQPRGPEQYLLVTKCGQRMLKVMKVLWRKEAEQQTSRDAGPEFIITDAGLMTGTGAVPEGSVTLLFIGKPSGHRVKPSREDTKTQTGVLADGEMAQWLRAFAVLAEDPVCFTAVCNSSSKAPMPSGFCSQGMHQCAYTHTQIKHS